MTEESNACPIRGAIKTIITTSTDNLEAGEKFSLFVTIQNPFEMPLIIHKVSTSFPTEFIDLDFLKHRNGDNVTSADQQTESGSPVPVPTDSSVSNILNRIDVSRLRVGIPGMTQMDIPPKTSVARSVSYFDDEGGAIPLQPGNSTVKSFTIKTRQNIRFHPSTYRLNIEIDYELNGCRNLDTIERIVNIRASLTSVMVGAVIGGIGGWFINNKDMKLFDKTQIFTNIISLIVTVIIALMAVVLLARKKEIQPLITVEDIWGGVAIGFIAASSGPKFLDTFIHPGGINNTS